MKEHQHINANSGIGIRESILMITVALYIAIDLTCDVTAHRYVSFFSMTLIGSSLIYPLTYCINDAVAELFGYKHARTMIWLGIMADFIFSFLIIGINKLPSPEFWTLKQSFIDVLDPMLRLNIGGFFGIIAGRFVGIYVISKTKILYQGRFYLIRSMIATAVGICAHSIVLDVITFYGVVPSKNFYSIMLTNYLSNFSSAVLLFWIPAIIVTVIKSRYKIDTFDRQVNYNPFSLK